MTRPVLVTGGAGSVGRRVVDGLVGSGRSVRVLDLPTMDFTGLEDRTGVEVVRGDITDADGVRRAVEGSGAGPAPRSVAPSQQRAGQGSHTQGERRRYA